MEMIEIGRGSIVLEDTQLCGVCKRQLVRIQFTLNGHEAEVRSCGLCDTRALSIDGVPVTKDDLLAGMSKGAWVPPTSSDDEPAPASRELLADRQT